MKKSEIVDLSTIVAQNENLLSSELDGDTVLMSVAQAAYYGLDATGRRIWNMIAEPRRVSDLCDQLTAEYDVQRTTCERDVCSFLNELYAENLVRIVDQDGG